MKFSKFSVLILMVCSFFVYGCSITSFYANTDHESVNISSGTFFKRIVLKNDKSSVIERRLVLQIDEDSFVILTIPDQTQKRVLKKIGNLKVIPFKVSNKLVYYSTKENVNKILKDKGFLPDSRCNLEINTW